ncbi:MAG: hypothetical protein FWG13_03490 [Leptospirales bacterium]|nr:hypothetical protein [Leptospirales bacterium]
MQTTDIQKLLTEGRQYDIEKKSGLNINETHAPFEGFIRARPSDKGVLLLFSDPFSIEDKFYEFSVDSISKAEDLGQIADEDGQTASRVRLWVKKGMPAIICESFIIK